MFGMEEVLVWLALLPKIIASGEGAWNAIKAALVDNGIDADTAQIDAVIADAARRKAIAEAEAAK